MEFHKPGDTCFWHGGVGGRRIHDGGEESFRLSSMMCVDAASTEPRIATTCSSNTIFTASVEDAPHCAENRRVPSIHKVLHQMRLNRGIRFWHFAARNGELRSPSAWQIGARGSRLFWIGAGKPMLTVSDASNSVVTRSRTAPLYASVSCVRSQLLVGLGEFPEHILRHVGMTRSTARLGFSLRGLCAHFGHNEQIGRATLGATQKFLRIDAGLHSIGLPQRALLHTHIDKPDNIF